MRPPYCSLVIDDPSAGQLQLRQPKRLLATALVLVALVSQVSPLVAERPAWTTSRVVGSPDPPKPFHVQRVYPELQFNQPVELLPLANTGKMILLEQGGHLYTFDDDPACSSADLGIDLRGRVEQYGRALGLAVHPDFAHNRQIFVAYSNGPAGQGDGLRLSRFVITDETPPRVDPESEEVVITWTSGGHEGCAIRFDSQGYLYFSAGDGASPFPPDEFDVSQNLSDLRSTICRIDVDHPDTDLPYGIPEDNPFVNTPGARPEIWAYGFRNPWRFTIAAETDRLFCGDVGWELWELVFDVRRGGNYGWSIFEGPQPIRSDLPQGPTPILKPLVAYPHAVGQSVTGGIVYGGSEHPELDGVFLYGDWVTGLVWGVRPNEDGVTWNPVLAETGLAIITFTESRDGEVLVVDYGGGIYRLVKNEAIGQENQFPRRLSETGLFESTETMTPAAGVIPYQLNAQSHQAGQSHQADQSHQAGTSSQFVIGVPGSETIRIHRQQRSWTYPTGTVVAKTILQASPTEAQPPIKAETQLLHFNGVDWLPYSYAWNSDQTDAILVESEGAKLEFPIAGSTETIPWTIANRAQCRACHSRQNGGAVGFTLANLDRPLATDPAVNQIDRLVELAILDRRAPDDWNIRPMVDPTDTTATLDQRARSYLVANCIHCHSRGAGGTVPLDLTYANNSDDINAIGVKPTQGDFGIQNAEVVRPGDPYHSVLYYRIATSGSGHMPKLAVRDNDASAIRLIHDWIVSLGDRSSDGKPIAIEQADPSQFTDTGASLKLFSQLLIDESMAKRRVSMAQSALQIGNPVTAAIFERFLPAEQRRKRLGDQIDPAQILAINGDWRHGREIFFDAQLGQCFNCHRVQGSGQSVGPDLDGIAGKRTGQQLLASVITPSQQIEPQFSTYLVLLDDGQVATGLKVAEDEHSLIIRQANGQDQRIVKERIESLRVQPASLMPSGLAAEMTADELADLLAFLGTLK